MYCTERDATACDDSDYGNYTNKRENVDFGLRSHSPCLYLAQNANEVTSLEGQFIRLVTMAIP